jgi:hypothetical protein
MGGHHNGFGCEIHGEIVVLTKNRTYLSQKETRKRVFAGDVSTASLMDLPYPYEFVFWSIQGACLDAVLYLSVRYRGKL